MQVETAPGTELNDVRATVCAENSQGDLGNLVELGFALGPLLHKASGVHKPHVRVSTTFPLVIMHLNSAVGFPSVACQQVSSSLPESGTVSQTMREENRRPCATTPDSVVLQSLPD
jgi:hypothetical protein